MTPKEALTKKVWAVLGATGRKEKFGYKIYACLRDHGYTVYPVNPNSRFTGSSRSSGFCSSGSCRFTGFG